MNRNSPTMMYNVAKTILYEALCDLFPRTSVCQEHISKLREERLKLLRSRKAVMADSWLALYSLGPNVNSYEDEVDDRLRI